MQNRVKIVWQQQGISRHVLDTVIQADRMEQTYSVINLWSLSYCWVLKSLLCAYVKVLGGNAGTLGAEWLAAATSAFLARGLALRRSFHSCCDSSLGFLCVSGTPNWTQLATGLCVVKKQENGKGWVSLSGMWLQHSQAAGTMSSQKAKLKQVGFHKIIKS